MLDEVGIEPEEDGEYIEGDKDNVHMQYGEVLEALEEDNEQSNDAVEVAEGGLKEEEEDGTWHEGNVLDTQSAGGAAQLMDMLDMHSHKDQVADMQVQADTKEPVCNPPDHHRDTHDERQPEEVEAHENVHDEDYGHAGD